LSNLFSYFLFYSISLNKNAVHGDLSAFSPGGIRIGTPALTSRNFKENDFLQVAEYIHQCIQLALKVQVFFYFFFSFFFIFKNDIEK